MTAEEKVTGISLALIVTLVGGQFIARQLGFHPPQVSETAVQIVRYFCYGLLGLFVLFALGLMFFLTKDAPKDVRDVHPWRRRDG